MAMKTVEYRLKGDNGQKVAVPAKYSRIAKGLVKEVLKLKDEKELTKLLIKHNYINQLDIFDSAKKLLEYYNVSFHKTSGEPASKLLKELKDNLYLRVCSYCVNKKFEKKKSRLDKEYKKINGNLLKMIKDNL
jgi:hypothetical protein